MNVERVYQHRRMLLSRLKAAKSWIETIIKTNGEEHASFAIQDIGYIIEVVENDMAKEKELL